MMSQSSKSVPYFITLGTYIFVLLPLTRVFYSGTVVSLPLNTRVVPQM